MTVDGFLTFLALVAAIWALLPPVERLRLKLVNPLYWWVAALSLLLILYLLFFDSWALPCLFPRIEQCHFVEKGFSHLQPEDWAFFVAVAWLIAFILLPRDIKLKSKQLPQFRRLVTELIREKRFGDATKLLSNSSDFLEKAAKRRSLKNRVFQFLEQRDPDSALFSATTVKPWQRWICKTRKLLPSGREAAYQVSFLTVDSFSEREFVRYLVRSDMALAVRLACMSWPASIENLDTLVCAALSEKGSGLYREVIASLDWHNSKPDFSERQPFMRFFFQEPEVAVEHSIWKPLGEYILREIERPGDLSEILNICPVDLEREAKNTAVFVVLNLFDHMVSSALWRETEHDMRLVYTQYFIRKLSAEFSPEKYKLDVEAEYPNLSTYFISELLRNMCEWLNSVRSLPETSFHRLHSLKNSDRNGAAIPWVAANCLGRSIRYILQSEKLTEKFKTECVELVFFCLDSLRNDETLSELYLHLCWCLVTGDDLPRVGNPKAVAYTDVFRHYFGQMNERVRYDAEDFWPKIGLTAPEW